MKPHKNNLYNYLCLSLVFLVALFGCRDKITFVKVESERTELIDGIESYQSIDEFKNFLSRNSWHWEERKGDSSSEDRPPFNIYVITIKNYSHLGFSGDLVVVFFNNRLMSTSLFPINFEKYSEALEEKGIKFDNEQKAKLLPYTEIKLGTDYSDITGRKYVAWTDIRLDNEFDIWIKRYS